MTDTGKVTHTLCCFEIVHNKILYQYCQHRNIHNSVDRILCFTWFTFTYLKMSIDNCKLQ